MSYLIPVRVKCDGRRLTENPCPSIGTVDVPAVVEECQDGDRVGKSHTVLVLDGSIPLPDGWDVVSKEDEWGKHFCAECKRP